MRLLQRFAIAIFIICAFTSSLDARRYAIYTTRIYPFRQWAIDDCNLIAHKRKLIIINLRIIKNKKNMYRATSWMMSGKS